MRCITYIILLFIVYLYYSLIFFFIRFIKTLQFLFIVFRYYLQSQFQVYMCLCLIIPTTHSYSVYKKLYTLFFKAIIYKTLSLFKKHALIFSSLHISPPESWWQTANGGFSLVRQSSSLVLLPPCTTGCPLPTGEGHAHSPSWLCQSARFKQVTKYNFNNSGLLITFSVSVKFTYFILD